MADRRKPADDVFLSVLPGFEPDSACVGVTMRQGDMSSTAWRTLAEAEALADHLRAVITQARLAMAPAAKFQQAAE
ncbi:MAG: hypothetical protein JWP57_4371 [Spirosoma sp.]|nr:hypothetical protein [Spirosoma sp.]